jgi:hypothetical protein
VCSKPIRPAKLHRKLLKNLAGNHPKESFKLFDNVFQFFRLAGISNDRRLTDEKNEEKFKWESLNDLQPLNVTSAMDMAGS